MTDLPPRATRLWSAILVGAGVALALFGGALQGFRPEPSGRIPTDAVLPVALEPRGELPAPPTVFRWTPGGDDVDLVQVAIYRSNLEAVWQSSPVQGSSIEVDPREVFEDVAAGEQVSWRVREISRGRARATSAAQVFSFAVDVHGRGPAQSGPQGVPLR